MYLLGKRRKGSNGSTFKLILLFLVHKELNIGVALVRWGLGEAG
jgi:hypothetical protein